MKKAVIIFFCIAIFLITAMEARAVFTISQGTLTQTVEPIPGITDAVSFYNYFSASAHTPFVEDQVSKIYLFEDPVGNISLIIHHSIDDSTCSSMKENFDLDGVPAGVYVAVSDDPYSTGDEFSLAVSPEGRWSHTQNSDGGVLSGLPTDLPWCIKITPEFIAGIERWIFQAPAGPEALDMDMPIEICFRPTPLPLAPVKWQQRPDMKNGVNIISTPNIDPPSILTVADDWLCLDGSPVSDLHFWGSYPYWRNLQPGPNGDPPGVDVFRIQVYSDVPVSSEPGFSHPGDLLYEVWVNDFHEDYVGSFPVSWPQGAEYEHKYRYDLDLPRMFWQKRDTVYWLNISAKPRNNTFYWGWENSMDRWNDFAVKGWYKDPDDWRWNPIMHPGTERCIDMSFELTTCEGPIKWLQFPDMANGRNIISMPLEPIVADDFLCINGRPITEIHFWGSYLSPDGNSHWEEWNPGPPNASLPSSPGVTGFKLSFHQDIPAGIDPRMPWSHPGELIHEVFVDSDQVVERYWDSIPHPLSHNETWWEHKFYYIVRMAEPFEQEKGRIYWLDIGALPRSENWVWGWETSMDHWNDNAVRDNHNNGFWENLGMTDIDFEDLALSASYHVGDTLITSEIPVSVKPFQWSNGQWTNTGHTVVQNSGLAGGSGNEMAVNNVNLDFGFNVPVKNITLLFGEYGGNLNIKINGDFKNFNNFIEINGTIIGGVEIFVINGLGDDKGILTLTGAIEQFAIGGQELWIDNVKFETMVDMAFLLITKDDTPYCKGDFRRDSDVDGSDLAVFAADYNRMDCHSTGDCEGDFNYNGRVGLLDLAVFAENFGRTDCPCAIPAGH